MSPSKENRKRAIFSEATAVEQLDSHTYRINLHPDYCIGKVPNGGYTASCMLVAANRHLAASGQTDTVTAHFEYPNRTSSGPAVVVVDEVKLGRSLSNLQLTLWQGDLLEHAPWVNTSASRRVVLACTTHADLSTFTGISLPTGYEVTAAASLPPSPDLTALKTTGVDSTWEQSRWPDVFEPAASSGNWRFFLPREGPLSPGVLDMWVCLANGENITQAALPYTSDSFPHNLQAFLAAPETRTLIEAPAPNEVEDAATKQAREEVARKNKQRGGMWFPTVLLNLETKSKLPDGGVEWLAVRATANQIKDGRFDLQVVIRDVHGQLVALGQQVALMETAHADKYFPNGFEKVGSPCQAVPEKSPSVTLPNSLHERHHRASAPPSVSLEILDLADTRCPSTTRPAHLLIGRRATLCPTTSTSTSLFREWRAKPAGIVSYGGAEHLAPDVALRRGAQGGGGSPVPRQSL
ncbi:thioesterase family protein [Metarhizium rileyi]|uniref:Thioesterase family protein n=1 Tax=Metarhizium rileyi (strain RCEF 4871) TaxID=1649241 RepID=A0A162M6W0_METRR|nr:thioesterase family protein [Metarhizium rileyi RCEF 4871]